MLPGKLSTQMRMYQRLTGKNHITQHSHLRGYAPLLNKYKGYASDGTPKLLITGVPNVLLQHISACTNPRKSNEGFWQLCVGNHHH